MRQTVKLFGPLILSEVEKHLLEKSQSPDLHAYVIWVPKRGGTESDVLEVTRFVSDSRSRHYWDPGACLMQRYARRLGLPRDAWDVYLIYGPGPRWEGDPPKPDFWMHQLASGAPAPELDGEQFAKEAIARLMRRASP